MDTTKLSRKGQIVLPRAIRAAKAWLPGQQLAVESTPEGVLLRPLKPFAPTKLADVVGCTGYKGPRKSVEEMDVAIASQALKGTLPFAASSPNSNRSSHRPLPIEG